MNLTIRIDDELSSRLAKMEEGTGQTRSALAKAALDGILRYYEDHGSLPLPIVIAPPGHQILTNLKDLLADERAALLAELKPSPHIIQGSFRTDTVMRPTQTETYDIDLGWLDIRGGIAAGQPIDAVANEPIPVGKKYPDDHYALRVFGESMAPKIPDGSLIVVREFHDQGFPRKGTIIVYSDASGSTLKEFGYRKAKAGEEANDFGSVPVLRSLNPAFPEVQTMEGGRIDAIYIETIERSNETQRHSRP